MKYLIAFMLMLSFTSIKAEDIIFSTEAFLLNDSLIIEDGYIEINADNQTLYYRPLDRVAEFVFKITDVETQGKGLLLKGVMVTPEKLYKYEAAIKRGDDGKHNLLIKIKLGLTLYFKER